MTFGSKSKGTEKTYISSRHSAEADSAAIFNYRITGTTQIHIDVGTVVHPKLATGDDNHAVLYTGDVSRSVNLATDNEAFLDALNGQTGIGFPVGGRNRHVDDTVAYRSNGGWHGRVGCCSRQHDMNAVVLVDRDRRGITERWSANLVPLLLWVGASLAFVEHRRRGSRGDLGSQLQGFDLIDGRGRI